MFNLSELLDLGYLQEGDALYWEQPRLGLIHVATINKGGQLITSDGSIHRTPSGAARHYYQKPIDGWHNWRLKRTGERLDEIRKKASNG
jgi:hypothetical protein